MKAISTIILLVLCLPTFAQKDCPNDDKTKLKEIESLVTSTKNKTMEDFLRSISDDKLPVFTFVTNSLSLQRGRNIGVPETEKNGNGQVSPLWPRIIRSSVDGRITMSYVCDKNNPAYGKVEVLSVDPSTGKVSASEWNFNQTQPKQRIHNNPASCISCHAKSDGQSLKFNVVPKNSTSNEQVLLSARLVLQVPLVPG